MSSSITLAELADIAIGTPNVGSVNFNALHVLLRGILEHLHLQDVTAEVSEEEREFLKPAAGVAMAMAKAAGAAAEGKSCSLFHEMQLRLGRVESQLSRLNGPPSTAELLAHSQAPGKPAADMWQMMQLKKKVEMNEEGVTKAMDTLQELLTTICSLKTTIEAFQEELQLLKDNLQKADLEDLRERLGRLDEHGGLLQSLLDQMAEVRRELSAVPRQADVVHWSTLCEALVSEKARAQEPSPEATQELARQALRRLSWLPEQHEAMGIRVTRLESQLQQHANVSTLDNIAAKLEKVQSDIKHLEDEGEKALDFRKDVLDQVGQLQEQRTRLQEAAERLRSDAEDVQVSMAWAAPGSAMLQEQLLPWPRAPDNAGRLGTWRFCLWAILVEQGPEWREPAGSEGGGMLWLLRQWWGVWLALVDGCVTHEQSLREMVEHLDVSKADKALLEKGLDIKADKAELETKVSQEELQSATAQLSDMMHDLLQKMSLQDQDWQKALEKLVSDMDSKLDHMVLDPLRAQLERVWKFTKKYLCQGPPFNANSAAGFKRQLFERVKCISCDRPVTMAPRPHLVTVRKANVLVQPRPASANSYKYLARQALAREGEGSVAASQGPSTARQRWPGNMSTTSPARQLSTSSSLTTICPYGDPAAFAAENTEVDILGINGVLYKGRLCSGTTNTTVALERDFPGMKTFQLPSQQAAEKMRPAKYGSRYVSPYSCAAMWAKAPTSGGRRQDIAGGGSVAGI
nr:PREDICTED: uncharacterized protein C16orf96 homolog [Apteryx mantelli mantelli]